MLNPVLAMAIGIVVMMVLIIFTKMHAFPSLIISAILIAVLAMPFGPEGATVATLTECVSTVTKGFGNTMASIGVVIGFGCIMGIFLEKSGAAKRMALTILKMVGVKNCDVVLGLTGFVVSIPVFCDSGFVILSSLAKEFSRLTKKSMVWLGGILGMGLYITHFMVPPTPGPLAVVGTFQENGYNLDLGMYIIFGILISVPLFIFSVFLFRYFGKKYPDLVVPYEIDRSKYSESQLKVLGRIQEKQSRNEDLATEDFADLLAAEKLPSAFLSFATLLVPIVLIFANTLVGQIGALQGTAFAECVKFLGQPVMALFISLCMGAFLLCAEYDRKTCVDLMQEACRDAGPIVFHHSSRRCPWRSYQCDRRSKDDGRRNRCSGSSRYFSTDHHWCHHAFPAGLRNYSYDYRLRDYCPDDQHTEYQSVSCSTVTLSDNHVPKLLKRFLFPRCNQFLRYGYQDQLKDMDDWIYSGSGIWFSYFLHPVYLYPLMGRMQDCDMI